MKSFSWMGRVVDAAGIYGAWVGVCACFAMMILVVANVIARFLWVSIPGTLDAVESLMVVVSAMLFAYTQAQRGHVGVELVLDRLPGRTRKVIGCITLLLTLVFILLVCWQNWRMGLDAWRAKDFAVGYPYVPLYPGKMVLSIGISLLCLQLIVDVVREMSALIVPQPK